uniref:Reverse transcriptase domain-containing protein n=1 Tax=Amphimedon queenslandica TaxID=400682 RepID=A0A1X7TSZ2_AMPQE
MTDTVKAISTDIFAPKYIPETLCFGSECTSDDQTKATLFNEYFFSVFTSNTSVVPPTNDRGPITSEHIDSVVCSEKEVYEILSSLNSTKAMGIDKINSKFPNKCAVPLPFLQQYSLISHSPPHPFI